MIIYLKVIVIVLGVLIAAGLVVIAFKVADLGSQLATSGGSESSEPESAPVRASMPAPSFAQLGLPPGTYVKSMEASEGRVVLNLRLPDTSERIVIIDMASGNVLADLALEGVR